MSVVSVPKQRHEPPVSIDSDHTDAVQLELTPSTAATGTFSRDSALGLAPAATTVIIEKGAEFVSVAVRVSAGGADHKPEHTTQVRRSQQDEAAVDAIAADRPSGW